MVFGTANLIRVSGAPSPTLSFSDHVVMMTSSFFFHVIYPPQFDIPIYDTAAREFQSCMALFLDWFLLLSCEGLIIVC